MKKIKLDIVGVSEVRRKEENLIELNSGNVFFYRGTNNGRTSGVGFIVSKKFKENVIEFESISDRVARIVIQITRRYRMQIVQVYAPTSSYSDEEVESFYEDLSQAYEKGKCHIKIVMGDFNARIGERQQSEISVGKFGFGERNERGDRLVEFAENHQLYVMNSFFKKKTNRKSTWRSPSGETSEIDFILTNRKHLFQDCSVLNSFITGSDHRMVRFRMKMNMKMEKRKLLSRKPEKVNCSNIKNLRKEFHVKLKNRFTALNCFEDDLSQCNEIITKNIMETALEVGGPAEKKIGRKFVKKRRN